MVAAPALPDLSMLEADALRSLLLDHHEQLLSNNN
jgi:transposase